MNDSVDDGRPSISAEALRAKYNAEREKRLRRSGNDQYLFTDEQYRRFEQDPFAPPPVDRLPVKQDVDVLIIGCGIGGIEMAAGLRHAGIDNFHMLDIAADFGGTWYWNRYPGLRCDVESYIYLPYLEETGYVPTERYIRGSEIFRYCQQLGRHFDLYDRALFQTKVSGMEWDEAAARWTVTSTHGDLLRARFVTTQSGIFSRPQLPGVPGINDFEGHAFHSARWDYAYTGGSSDGGLDALGDKRVGLIGTGTTALQIVPELARAAKSLTIFQRTPSAVGIRNNGPTDLEWFRSLPPEWQKARDKSFNQLANFENVDCPVEDGWAQFFRKMIRAAEGAIAGGGGPEDIALAQELADFQHNEVVRARVDDVVKDPDTAALLKAYYRTMCKRPGFSDEYLPIFNRDNVKLVDVSGGINRITERGVLVDGIEHELDCLVFCTGFELGTTWVHQAGYDIVGRDGQRLSEKWANGLVTYHGLFSRGFPNMFFMGLTQTGTTVNVPLMLQEQVDHIVHIITQCRDQRLMSVEAGAAAEAGWQVVIAEMNEIRRPFQEACTPGYFNAEGQPNDRRSAIGSGMYMPSTRFFEMLSAWRDAGTMEGLDVRHDTEHKRHPASA